MKGSELRGIVPVELGGESFNLCFDMNALCDIEDKFEDLDKAFNEKMNMSTARYLLWVGLQHAHEDKFKDPKSVGRLITLHNLPDMIGKLGQAFRLAVPEPEEKAEKK